MVCQVSVCTTKYKIFFSICLHAKKLNLLVFSKMSYKSTFTTDGFGHWGKALKLFEDHEKSNTHKEAMAKLAAVTKSVPISTRRKEQNASAQSLHRGMLMKVLGSIKFLARQGLALRGHNNDTEGNLHQLLLLRAEDDATLREWLSKSEYTSPMIINEIIVLMGQEVSSKTA